MDSVEWLTFHTIGYARSGDPQAAREALVQLQSAIIGTETPGTVSYLIWDGQALSMAAEAWVSYAEGEFERAVMTMAAAAERPASLLKLPLPSGELLGDMYLELGRYDEGINYLRSSSGKAAQPL